MKKTIGILMCAVIILTSVITLSACKKSDAQKIIGSWHGQIDMSKALIAEMGSNESMGGSLDLSSLKDLFVTVHFEFGKDGDFKISIDEKSFDEFFVKMKSQMNSIFEAYIRKTAEDSGIDLETVLTFMGISSVDELVDSTYNDEMKKEMLDDAKSEGKYKIEDGKLFTAETEKDFKDTEYVKYEFISAQELRFNEAVSEDEEDSAFSEMMMPLTLKKEAAKG